MNVLAIIPARMGSSRFPGKPLAKINGIPMIQHVFERVNKSKSLNKVVVATCDEEIFDFIHSIDGEAIMTSSSHERASDRCAEALALVEEKDNIRYDIIVMVQGDEPMTHPNMVEEALSPMLKDDSVLVVNLMSKIENNAEFQNPNCIKVVCDLEKNAIFFSRKPIPSNAFNTSPKNKQVCIIPFTRQFLLDYTKMSPTPLEVAESVDMMRVIENGFKVRMVKTNYNSHAVDSIEDIDIVEALMRSSDFE